MNRFKIALGITILAVSSSMFAGEIPGSAEANAIRPATSPVSGDQEVPALYGTAAYTPRYIGAPAFLPRNSDTTYVNTGNGTFYRTGGSNTFWADVDLPQGAKIFSVRLFYFDSNAAEDIAWELWRYSGSAAPLADVVASGSSSGSAGWGSAVVGAIDYTVIVDPTLNDSSDDGYYAIRVTLPVADSSLQLKGVRIYWQRQVSAGPAVATFADVPTSHGFFRFVEALAAAGITGGCGGGNFCPNTAVTRGQMAVFLASALGLHFPPQ